MGVSGCTCAPWEDVALAQVAVLDVELQVRLLPEVPCARRAPEHLLLVAVFDRQVHLGENGGSEREQLTQSTTDALVSVKSSSKHALLCISKGV